MPRSHKRNLHVIGDRIREARERLGLKQSDLADRAGMTQATLSQFEAGIRRPSVETLIGLADALNVSADWLLGRETSASLSGPRIEALQEAVEDLDDRSLRSLIEIAKALKNTQGRG